MGTSVVEVNRFQYSKLDLVYERGPKNDPKAVKGFSGAHKVFSNFYPVEFEMGGVKFRSSEHAFMYQKSDDPIYRRAVLAARDGKAAKLVGRGANLSPDWDNRGRYVAMFRALSAKFNCIDEWLRLCAPGPIYLEETNWWNDIHWGVCRGRGENHLGRLLMCVRYSMEHRIELPKELQWT